MFLYLDNVSMTKSSSDTQPVSETSTTSVTPNTPSNNEEEDDYIQCSLETVYTSTEMAVSPPCRPCASQQTDNEYTRAIVNEFLSLKTDYEETKSTQHDLILTYHETISKVITSLQQSNQAHQELIEQLRAELTNHLQDNETLKVNHFRVYPAIRPRDVCLDSVRHQRAVEPRTNEQMCDTRP